MTEVLSAYLPQVNQGVASTWDSVTGICILVRVNHCSHVTILHVEFVYSYCVLCHVNICCNLGSRVGLGLHTWQGILLYPTSVSESPTGLGGRDVTVIISASTTLRPDSTPVGYALPRGEKIPSRSPVIGHVTRALSPLRRGREQRGMRCLGRSRLPTATAVARGGKRRPPLGQRSREVTS